MAILKPDRYLLFAVLFINLNRGWPRNKYRKIMLKGFAKDLTKNQMVFVPFNLSKEAIKLYRSPKNRDRQFFAYYQYNKICKQKKICMRFVKDLFSPRMDEIFLHTIVLLSEAKHARVKR